MNRLLESGGRVLGFGAHPDDLEVGAGGLLARLARQGCRVTMCVVAVPNQGEHRIPEAKAAANVIGADCVFLYDEKPARVEDIPMHELVARMDRLLGATKPDLVITHSEHDLHWDHGLVNRATVSALRRTPCDLLAFLSSPQMNAQHRAIGQCFADITSTLETKIAAIQEHKSQLAKLDIESSKDLARAMGRISGYGYAESYEALRVRI